MGKKSKIDEGKDNKGKSPDYLKEMKEQGRKERNIFSMKSKKEMSDGQVRKLVLKETRSLEQEYAKKEQVLKARELRDKKSLKEQDKVDQMLLESIKAKL